MAPERGLPQLSLVHCESTWDRPVGRMGDKGDPPNRWTAGRKKSWWVVVVKIPRRPLFSSPYTGCSCGRLRRHRKKQTSDEGRLALTKHSHLPALQAWSGRAARPGHHSEGQDSLSATCKQCPQMPSQSPGRLTGLSGRLEGWSTQLSAWSWRSCHTDHTHSISNLPYVSSIPPHSDLFTGEKSMSDDPSAYQKQGLEMVQKPRLEIVFLLFCFSSHKHQHQKGCSEAQLQPWRPQIKL